jgi:hypothetical protein
MGKPSPPLRKAADLRKAYDSVVELAELGSFMDAPLRTYSSGMTARLAFAVATHRRADVLLVDEVLAVGDVLFQGKCRRRMKEFRTEGADGPRAAGARPSRDDGRQLPPPCSPPLPSRGIPSQGRSGYWLDLRLGVG